MQDFLVSYDNVCLRPRHSSLVSRSLANTSIDFCGYDFKLPVVPANMTDVISFKNAEYLSKNGYFYIMHRFNGAIKKFGEYALMEELPVISLSIGVNEEARDDISAVCAGLRNSDRDVDFITIDVAHGDHDNVKNMVNWLHDYFDGWDSKPKIIAGNIATVDGYKFLCGLGVDAVKVGIGGGSICSTRYKTGFHLPTAASILECRCAGIDIPIIADGGAKYFGDVAKALALGADMVMSGRWFAECIDSPAEIRNGKKIYRGSTSYESKGHNNHVEGHTLEISEGCTYAERLIEIQQALSSAISYAGGKDLSALQHVDFELIQ